VNGSVDGGGSRQGGREDARRPWQVCQQISNARAERCFRCSVLRYPPTLSGFVTKKEKTQAAKEQREPTKMPKFNCGLVMHAWFVHRFVRSFVVFV
jgi:hypothetical protein